MNATHIKSYTSTAAALRALKRFSKNFCRAQDLSIQQHPREGYAVAYIGGSATTNQKAAEAGFITDPMFKSIRA